MHTTAPCMQYLKKNFKRTVKFVNQKVFNDQKTCITEC